MVLRRFVMGRYDGNVRCGHVVVGIGVGCAFT